MAFNEAKTSRPLWTALVLLLSTALLSPSLAAPATSHQHELAVAAASDSTGSRLSDPSAADAKADLPIASVLRGSPTASVLLAAAGAFAEAEADGETMAGLVSQSVSVAKAGGEDGPSTLAEYCALDMYIDAACQLQGFLSRLQDQLKQLTTMMSQWLAAQQTNTSSGQVSHASAPKAFKPILAPAVVARASEHAKGGARIMSLLKRRHNQVLLQSSAESNRNKENVFVLPSSTSATSASKDKNKLLLHRLADQATYIKELGKRAEANNRALQKFAAMDATVDSLLAATIAVHRTRTVNPEARIQELLKLINDQEKELAHLGGGLTSLQDIHKAVFALDEDLVEAKRKRMDLKGNGSLDADLRAMIDPLIQALEAVRKKMDHLVTLEAKSEIEKEMDHLVTLQDEPVTLEAKAQIHKEEVNRKESGSTDVEVLQAARDVLHEMKEAEKWAIMLNTELHPHGSKWWRYRYEHSYIESFIMILITLLMLVWSEVVRFSKTLLKAWALPGDVQPKSELQELEEETHGTIYYLWVKSVAEQMIVCILVFVTIWAMGQSQLMEYLPVLIKQSEDMRVPHTGEEYRRLSLDMCMIFFFGVAFYYALMYAVARDTRIMTSTLEDFEQSLGDSQACAQATGSLASSSKEFQIVKRYFLSHMQAEMACGESGQTYNDIRRLLGNDLGSFPLWMYLKLHVRTLVSNLFTLGWTMRLLTTCLFLVCMMCHRFAHMAYVRIVFSFAFATFVILAFVAWYTKNTVSEIQKSLAFEPQTPRSKKETCDSNRNPESVILAVLQLTVFFVCYGVARMIGQPWLWQLHFWSVLTLTVVTLFTAVLFVWLVSPTIPCFCAVMALPPHVSQDKIVMMQHVAATVSRKSPTRSPSFYVRTPRESSISAPEPESPRQPSALPAPGWFRWGLNQTEDGRLVSTLDAAV